MSIYTIDTDYIAEQLTPPKLRKVKLLAWLKVLLVNLKYFFVSFDSYRDGFMGGAYNGAITYQLNDLVYYTDKAIYLYTSKIPSIGIPPSNTTYWTLLQTVFIGSNERVTYNSQKKLFEYALNRFFVTSGIYITNNFIEVDNVFLMGQVGSTSSYMPQSSVNQIDYIGQGTSYITGTNDFTIFVPTLFYATLGIEANNIIRAFADKYVLAGITYNVQSI